MLRRITACAAAGGLVYTLFSKNIHVEAQEFARRRVGLFEAGGILFKDKIEVMAVSDPKVEGVTCFISTGERAINPFTDPASASISCVQTGKIRFLEPINLSQQGEDVFSQSKNFLFKELKVKRLYDRTSNTLVYVSYNSRLLTDNKNQGSRFQTSIDCIPLYDVKPPQFK
jgi:CreA protein